MILKGNPVSPGIAIGPLYIYEPFHVEISENFCARGETGGHKDAYLDVKNKAVLEIEAISSSLENDDPEKAKIFIAHRDILNDPAIHEEITEGIESELWTAEWAIWKIYAKFIKMIQKAKDPVIRERAADFEDVRKRLLRIHLGVEERNLSSLDKPSIVAARDLLPSDTATLDRRSVLAILAEQGSATSHSAIIARSYEIPAVLGIKDLMGLLKQGDTAAVDALKGEVFLNPDGEQKAVFALKREAYLREAAETKEFLKKEPLMADGTRIAIGLNIGDANDEELAGAECTDFVGLFRTEFLYMGRDELPSEDEQFEVYRKVLELYGKREVSLRTLDIGGDKTLQCMDLPKEENPFLGKRALRLCFSYPEIFKTQLRAALRSSVYGNLNIMLPMVGSIDDIRRAKVLLEEAKAELDAKAVSYGCYKLGIMIEIPSIAMIADLAAQEVDFASIGTNDLCQYLTATDRMNSDLSGYYQPYHPAMFRIIGRVAREFTWAGKPVSVCGEMGGDKYAAAVLVGLGIHKLSMGFASVAGIKKMLSGLSMSKAEEMAVKVIGCFTAAEAEEYLRQNAVFTAKG
jgi:phosphotransferase system enzyme I (PtsI)